MLIQQKGEYLKLNQVQSLYFTFLAGHSIYRIDIVCDFKVIASIPVILK